MLGDRSSENSGRTKNSPLSLVLGPVIKLVFSEKARRRRRCRELFKERYGIGEFGARFGKGRRIKAARLGGELTPSGGGAGLVGTVAAALTLPLRGLFVLISKSRRWCAPSRGSSSPMR